MAGGVHHIYKRKRVHKKLEEYPHPKKWVRWFDRFLLIFAVIGPLAAFPQVFKIYYLQSAGDLSLITWGLLSLGNIPWIIYGFVHKEKPIMVAYISWFIVNLAIIIGILIYS